MGDEDYTRVYVGGLNETIKKEDLQTEFEKFGKLNKVWVAFNPPGFAFIEFCNLDEAEVACNSMNGTDLMGAKLRVEISRGRGRGRGVGVVDLVEEEEEDFRGEVFAEAIKITITIQAGAEETGVVVEVQIMALVPILKTRTEVVLTGTTLPRGIEVAPQQDVAAVSGIFVNARKRTAPCHLMVPLG